MKKRVVLLLCLVVLLIVATMSGLATAQPGGSGLQANAGGPSFADVPRNSSEALRGLIAWRIACQDELTLSLRTDVQSLAEEYGDKLESVSGATESLSLLEGDISSVSSEARSSVW